MTESDRIEFFDRLSRVSNGKLAVFFLMLAGLVVEVSHFAPSLSMMAFLD